MKNAQLGTRAPAQTPQAQGALSSGAVSDPEQEVESPLRGAWHWDRRSGAQMTRIGDCRRRSLIAAGRGSESRKFSRDEIR